MSTSQLNPGHSFQTHDGASTTFGYIVGGESPSIKLWWLDDQGALIDLSSGYTLSAVVKKGATDYLAKNTGITGAAGTGTQDDGTPNITIEWDDGELDNALPNPGLYTLVVFASNDSTDADLFLTFQLRYSNPGALTWTYSGDPSDSDRDAVRFLIGDTDSSDQLVTDQEIDWMLSEEGSKYPAASELCRAIAARFARCIDRSTGALSRTFSQKYQHYLELSDKLLSKVGNDLAAPWASGLHVGEKQAREDDMDLVAPHVLVGMHDVPANRSVYDPSGYDYR